MPWLGSTPLDDGQQQFVDWADAEVAAGRLSIDDATRQVQAHGITTGPGAYQAPGQAQAETDQLNEQSRQSAARSAAYQKSREGNPEGYTQESQDAWDAAHPLSDY